MTNDFSRSRSKTLVGSPAVGYTPAPAVPPDQHPVWAGLVKGTIQHDFGYATAGMLLFNLNLQWRRDPRRLGALVQTARAFFHKYQHLLAADIQRLFSQS